MELAKCSDMNSTSGCPDFFLYVNENKKPRIYLLKKKSGDGTNHIPLSMLFCSVWNVILLNT